MWGLDYRAFTNESVPMKSLNHHESLNHHVLLKYNTMKLQLFIISHVTKLRFTVYFSYNL